MSDNNWMMSAFTFGKGLEGVDESAGILKGVAIVTEGRAEGHGVRLDSEFVENVVKLGNDKKLGVKVRFGHPTMSSESLGTFIGRAKNLRMERDAQGISLGRGDIQISETAAETPNGNLAGYITSLATKEPDVFGMSIVFTPGDLYKRDAGGEKIYEGQKSYQSIEGEPFIEIDALHAADMVDIPPRILVDCSRPGLARLGPGRSANSLTPTRTSSRWCRRIRALLINSCPVITPT